MSNSIIPLTLLKTEDPVTKINNVRPYTILKGGALVGYSPLPPSGQPNTSSNSFTINPNNRRTIMDRKIYIRAQFILNFTGTGATGGLLQGGYDAPRASPLTKIIQQMSLKIGNNGVQTNLNEYYNVYERFNSDHDFQNRSLSISPSMPDQYSDYSSSALADNSELMDYRFNNSQCPRGFAPFGSSSYGGATAANPAYGSDGTIGNSWCQITQNRLNGLTAGATASVVLTVCEPIYLSPMLYEKINHSGLVGIDSLVLNIQFNNLQMLWSHSTSSPSTISAAPSVTIGSDGMQCLVRQVNPDIVQPLPEMIPYPYYTFSTYPSASFTLAAGQSIPSVVLGNIDLKTIPSRCMVYIQQQQSDRSMTSTDTFAVIGSMNLTWNSAQLFGSNCTQQDLYNMSVKNGCNMSWEQWSNKVGSIICFDFGIDVGLNPNQVAGLLQSNTINVQVNNIINNSSVTKTYQLYLLVIEEGTISIVNGATVVQVGVISEMDALKAENKHEIVPYRHDRNISGGNFFGDFWSGFKKPFEFIYDNRDTIANVAKEGAKYAPLLGLGRLSESDIADLAVEGGRRRSKHSRKHSKGKGRRRSKHSRKHSKGKGGRRLSKKHLK